MAKVFLVFATLAFVPNIAFSDQEWNFSPAPPGLLFGPALWIDGEMARIHIECRRYAQDIRPNPSGMAYEPVVAPRRLEVQIDWDAAFMNPDGSYGDFDVSIAETNRDIRSRLPSQLEIRIDDGELVTESWLTMAGRWQFVWDDDALRFLRMIGQAQELRISAEFSDSKKRTQTFNLSGFGELLTRMEPNCAKLREEIPD